MDIKHKITSCGEFLRVTVFTPNGTCSKTVATAAEANAFVSEVKSKKSSVPSRRAKMKESA